mmetsp:Transcript_37131/g.44783  ORF Transcript_37131/g.44783 Transcript_37131/m.44783 type:complete len:335 (+) Transcript_37131:193-1197(+)|eukprot:CAMPEP_0194379188 /NCGR_PEP_ID=MMETSP0174-20130528/38416_1 /TAXON_ID=216777 /ORGANISM="Proboscia alata, Strain PI-D3" /LENGTH=334 /DNA_ID=CAMNT_0039161721 /DNA_START=172 /DNA_END=1176 /DNA_ORIENTATION=+
MTVSSSIMNPAATRLLSAGMRRKLFQNHNKAITEHVAQSSAASMAWRPQDDSSLQQQQQQQHQQQSTTPQQHQFLISPKLKPKSDLVVVLDMDECMIHSQFLTSDEYKFRQRDQQLSGNSSNNTSRNGGWNQYDNNRSNIAKENEKTVESFKIVLPDNDIVIVNKRPYLDAFLSKVSQRSESHVFTAALEVYASPVLDTLDPTDTIFSHRFYRERCALNEEMGVYVKDLGGVLPFGTATTVQRTQARQQKPIIYNEKRMVLIDNNPLSFLANPKNGILVSNFYDDAKDTSLKSVLTLLDELDDVEDVRPVLDDLFGLTNALKDIVEQQQRQQQQ